MVLDISGHLRAYRDERGFEDEKRGFVINCCGYQKFITEDFGRNRQDGRLDYQIIYIYSGSGYFWLMDGESNERTMRKVEAGNIVVYQPEEPQIYTYYAKEQTEVYWIHFTGNQVKELLQRFQVCNRYVGEQIQFKHLFQEIILELQLQKPCFEEISNSIFLKLIALIQRTKQLSENTSQHHFAIDRLIIALNQHYTKQWTVSTMASYCHLSNDYFAHLFKEVTATTPIHFLTKLRIEKSKELLLAQGMGIADIAFLVGYTDPLYYSRVFKKVEGVSPKEYRREALTLQTPFSTNA